ncbi:hypothetical protein LCGC14_3017650, partial [marine sediment metagenome]
MKDKIEPRLCEAFAHPVKKGVPAWQCTEYAI